MKYDFKSFSFLQICLFVLFYVTFTPFGFLLYGTIKGLTYFGEKFFFLYAYFNSFFPKIIDNTKNE